MPKTNQAKNRSLLLLMLTVGIMIFVAACSSDPAEPTAQPVATTAAPAVVEPTAPPVQEVAQVPTEAPTAEAAVEPTAEPVAEAPAASTTVATFVIDPAQSQVRFYIDEELLGQPKRVEGINGQVAGEVTVNLGDYAQIDFSPITVAANAFITDNDRRNGAINRFVLQTGQYSTITFTPTGVENLPAEIAVGQPFSFQLVGDLTIREITTSVTLEMTVTPVSESELQGSGSVTVLRESYDLSIPSVPSVANVSEDVLLEIDFVAVGK